MEKAVGIKRFFIDALKSALIAIIIGAILTLVFAIVINYFPVENKIVTIVNQAIKVIAVLLGCIIGIGEKKSGLLKGLFCGIVYSLGTTLIYAIINKDFGFSWGVLLDIGLSAAIGLLSGVLSVNISKRK